MLIPIEGLFTKEEVATFRTHLEAAEWLDGGKTAGSLAASVKRNLQLDDASDTAIALGNEILRRLGHHPLFISAALPAKILPPKFNRYQGGGTYGAHVDSSLMGIPGTREQLRTDLSATIFFSEPDEYEGGELQIETPFGMQEVKLAAGDMILYPSSSLHQVTPVTSGARISSFFWIQSMVKDEAERTLLFDLDQSIQAITAAHGKVEPSLLKLTGVYHNLLRKWVEI
jgi:PKHD-type hydroxylase